MQRRAPYGLRLNLTRDSEPLPGLPGKAELPLVDAPGNLSCAICGGNSGIANRISIGGYALMAAECHGLSGCLCSGGAPGVGR
jgi:hypothetical protein